MDTLEVEPEQWAAFIQDFSRTHEGWLASIEVLDPATGPQKVAQGQPLQGISIDTKGTEPSSIAISVGDQAGSHIHHVVSLPLHIRLAQEQMGADVDLQIEPATGPQTLMHLQSPSH